VLGFVILIGLQFAIAWAVIHWSPMRVIVNPRPTLRTARCALADMPELVGSNAENQEK
jgi:hypothetical protein